jgi:hypothetical protein
LFARFRFWPARRFAKTLTDREIPRDAHRDKGVAKDEPIVNEVTRSVAARANEALENAEVKANAAEGKAVTGADSASVAWPCCASPPYRRNLNCSITKSKPFKNSRKNLAAKSIAVNVAEAKRANREGEGSAEEAIAAVGAGKAETTVEVIAAGKGSPAYRK